MRAMADRAPRATRLALLAVLAAALVSLLAAPRAASAQACGSGPPEGPPPDPRFVLGAGAMIGVLNLPNLGAGITVLGQLGTIIPIDLALGYYFDNTDELLVMERDLGLHPLFGTPWPPGGSRTAFSIVQASAGVCPLRHELVPGTLFGCGGLYGGLMRAAPEGFVAAEDVLRPVLGLEAYARWRYTLGGPIGLTYSAGLFVPLLRPAFGYVDSRGRFSEQFRVSPLGGRLDVALSYAFE
jgi:hypothetical protein